MYVLDVRNWDDEVVVKRLSKNEKAILLSLRLYQKVGPDMGISAPKEYYGRFFYDDDLERYQNGRIVAIGRLRRAAGIKHRASLSRTLKRLEEKQLVYFYGHNMTDRESDCPCGTGKYTKYVSLTAAGEMVADILEPQRDNILS
jgi:hypothetical protein